SFKKYMANREIKQNIKKFESVGSKVKYYPIDILNKNSMIHAINEVKTIYGPISGIIHGAGVLADRLITDKTPEQFELVFNTKVSGLQNLLESTAGDNLKHLIILSFHPLPPAPEIKDRLIMPWQTKC
ncbi:MAG: SDR family NAD(P)-dependent oxidoreductase, partial [Deltaproteobacteria bacterium]|nr:SDR family NAD(P)-dependent oxidoreductase [Deltaproteobacteria bacterium]